MGLDETEEKKRRIKWGEGEGGRRSGGECEREARLSRSLRSTPAFSRSDGGYRHKQAIVRSITIHS